MGSYVGSREEAALVWFHLVFDRNRIFSLSADNDIDRNERADTKVWPKVNFLAISAERTDTTKRNCNNAP